MKRTTRVTLAAAAFLALALAVALLTGRDDIKRFRRMSRM
jgi:hypothetical protein